MDETFETARQFLDIAKKYNGKFDLNVRDNRVVFTIYDDNLVKMMNDLNALLGPA